jgi:hypothetical protein
MLKIIRSNGFKKFISIAALSFFAFGILLIFASCLFAHHGEGIANRRPSDIARGVGISGSLALVAGAGLGLTNGIQPTVESLLGNGKKPEGGTEEGEKEEKEKEEEKEPEKEEETEEEPEKEEESEEEQEEGGITLDDLRKTLKDTEKLRSALSGLITIEGARQNWTKYTEYIDKLTKQLDKMGKPWAQKWKDAVLKKAGWNLRKDFPNESKLVKGAGHLMRVIDGLQNVLKKIEDKGYTDPLDIGCALVEETGKQVLNWAVTKNPFVGLADTIVSTASGGKYSVKKAIDAGADKWDDITQEWANNYYNNDDKISQQLQGQWNLSKNKIMNNPNLSHQQKVQRLKRVFNILFK